MIAAGLLLLAAVLAGYFLSRAWKRRETAHAAEVADLKTAHASDVMRLETMLASAEHDTEQAEEHGALIENLHDYNTDVLRMVAAERDDLEAAALPTIDANRLDVLASIGAQALAATGVADVVPIGAKRGRVK
jgi:hypothetical protein